jgi:drug/metabolite transporter (DMT)-like permease
LGGTAVAVTRFITRTLDPLAIGALRFGIGTAVLLPLAVARGATWPQRRDLGTVAGLGLLFFAVFPLLFNAALVFTTAARASLSLSTLPLLTLALGAALGVEALTVRKTAGVLLAMAGVALSLLASLADAPPGAWRGDLLMVGAALCMALYSVLSRPVIRRCDPLAFTAAAMGVGAPCLAVAAFARGSFRPVEAFGPGQWTAVLFLGVAGTALAFALWSLALRHTTPTRVAVSVSVNPVSASLTAADLLREPVPWTTWPGCRRCSPASGLR